MVNRIAPKNIESTYHYKQSIQDYNLSKQTNTKLHDLVSK